MKTKKLHKDKVNIITLGCSKNMVDSEVLSGQLLANEIDVVHENKKLDHNIVVVNTCGFIEKAKEESINTILEQVELKNKGSIPCFTIASVICCVLLISYYFVPGHKCPGNSYFNFDH